VVVADGKWSVEIFAAILKKENRIAVGLFKDLKKSNKWGKPYVEK
jgi:hypothetical protein